MRRAFPAGDHFDLASPARPAIRKIAQRLTGKSEIFLATHSSFDDDVYSGAHSIVQRADDRSVQNAPKMYGPV